MLRRLSPREQQYGQAMVFVVLFLGVVTLSLVFLYKAGKITSEKMQLQNAADAAAYSVSLTEARDLNFMAYTNRAMVANEVAIGQLVGMASWAAHWESFGIYLAAYHQTIVEPLISAASLGTATAPVRTVFTIASNVFKTSGKLFIALFKQMGKIGATVMHTINKVYGVVQTGYHYASILYGISAYIDVVNDNAPNAKISDFGMMALIAHTLTYTDIIPGYDSFIKTYKPTDADMAEGYERFAAVVNGSRDEFSRHRGWELPLDIPPLPINIDYTCSGNCPDGDSEERFEIPLTPLGTLYFEFLFQFELDLQKEGGSELRYVGDTAQGDQFNWSAADTTELALTFALEIGAGFESDVFFLPNIGANVSISLGDGEATAALTLNPIGQIFEETVPFITGAPFSSGAAQIGNVKLNADDLIGVSTDSYGNSPTNTPSWSVGIPPFFIPSPGIPSAGKLTFEPPPSVPTVTLTMPMEARRINTSYKGLPMYNDNILKDKPWGIEAPYFLAGVVIDDVDIYRSKAPLKTVGPNETPGSLLNNTNFFYLDDSQIADQELGAIAKSEVYFSRPLDLAYFSRADDAEEYGSAFNPYWQARLVQTTNADRVLSIAIQQKQTFGVIAQIQDIINNISSLPTDPTQWFP